MSAPWPKLWNASPTLAAIAGGTFLAWAWLEQPFPIAIWKPVSDDLLRIAATLAAFGLLAFGAFRERQGRLSLPLRPVEAVRLLEWRLLTVVVFGAFITAIGLVIAVNLEPSKDASTLQKRFAPMLAGAVTAFLTALFVGNLADLDAKNVAPTVQDAFEKRYLGMFKKGSDARDAVYAWDWGAHDGWGRKARRARAHAIASAPPGDRTEKWPAKGT